MPSEFITNVQKISKIKKIWRWILKYSFRIVITTFLSIYLVGLSLTIDDILKIEVLIAEQNIEMAQIQATQYTIMDDVLIALKNKNEQSNAKIEDLANTVTTLGEALQQSDAQRNAKIEATLSRMAQKPTYDYLKSITVYLKGKAKDPTIKKGWGGTGVIIKVTKDETYILTNNHMCEWNEDSICYVEDIDTKVEYPITLVKSNHFDEDIQVVKFSGRIPGKQAVKGVADSKIQESVYMVGQNNGTPFVYGEGTVAGTYGDHDLLLQMSSTHGNSGSGIINKDGYLVGLLYAGQIISPTLWGIADVSHAICINSKVVRLMTAGIIE